MSTPEVVSSQEVRELQFGEKRLVGAQPLVAQHPQIGGHAVPGRDLHQVVRDQLVSGQLRPPAVAAHHGRLGNHRRQCLDGPTGPVLLDKADDRAQHHHSEHDGAVGVPTQGQSDRGRHTKRIDQRATELTQQDRCPGRARPSLDLVGRVQGQPLLGLCPSQAVRARTGRHRGIDVVGVPRFAHHRSRHGCERRPVPIIVVLPSSHGRPDIGNQLPGRLAMTTVPPWRGGAGASTCPRGGERGVPTRPLG